MQHRFAECFGGDGAGVDADAANHATVVDDRDTLAEFGGLNRGALTGRT